MARAERKLSTWDGPRDLREPSTRQIGSTNEERLEKPKLRMGYAPHLTKDASSPQRALGRLPYAIPANLTTLKPRVSAPPKRNEAPSQRRLRTLWELFASRNPAPVDTTKDDSRRIFCQIDGNLFPGGAKTS